MVQVLLQRPSRGPPHSASIAGADTIAMPLGVDSTTDEARRKNGD
jgi:hypothetical protein